VASLPSKTPEIPAFCGNAPPSPSHPWRRKPAPVAADHEELAGGGRFHGHQRGQLLRMQAAHLEVNHQPRGYAGVIGGISPEI